jgi:hypothetical protein
MLIELESIGIPVKGKYPDFAFGAAPDNAGIELLQARKQLGR